MLLLLIFSSLFALSQASIWDNLDASIVVVEYEPILGDVSQDLEDVITLNVQKYQEIISSQPDKPDMIIFPEDTLRNTPATSVEVVVNTTCDSTTDCPNILKSLSSAARQNQTYLVVNFVSKEKCKNTSTSTNCKQNGFQYYNTDVVFDRNGTIIAKYRKYNLFGEWDLDRPEVAEEVIFTTDFNVTFGIFTCFDILFKAPAQDMLRENLDAVIFPTMWFSELPFLTAIQTQQMWAQEHDITLFAAGANNPERGSGGSGIYRGSNGAVLSGIVAQGGTQPFTYSGEIQPSKSDSVDVLAKQMDNFTLGVDPSLADYKSEVLNITNQITQTELCYKENQFCCKFNIKTATQGLEASKSFYTYLLVAYSGVRSFTGVYNGGIEICGILACKNSSLSSCGQRFEIYEEVQWPTTFEELIIEATFKVSDNKTQFPNSLLSSIRPIAANETEWSKEEGDESVTRTFSLKKSQDRLLTFAIFGRDFGLDAPADDNGDNSGNPMGISWCLLLCSLIFFKIYNESAI